MADTIEIVQGTATVVQVAGPTGPQGPKGDKGDAGATGAQGVPGTGLEVLTTQGDILYQGASTGQRLGIGTAGQILKVNSGGTAPEWGAAPASGVSSVNGQTGAVTVAAVLHSHQPSAIYCDAADVADTTFSSGEPNGIYFRDGIDNGKAIYKSSQGYALWWDDGEEEWVLGNVPQTAKYYIGTGDTTYPWEATSWALGPQGSGDAPVVDQSLLSNYQRNAAKDSVSTRAPKSGNASSSEVVLGNDSRLSDSRTPTSHTHTLSAITDAGTAAAVDADQDLNTTSNVTFDVVNVNSDLVASSIKANSQIQIEDNNSYLATLTVGSDILSANRNYQLPNASGTLALTTDAPPAHAATHAATGSDPVSLQLTQVVAPSGGLGPLGEGETLNDYFANAGNIVFSNTEDFAASGSITTSGLTQATARILGRTSASAGAIEEIQIGSGLSLSAGELSATSSGGISAVGASIADVLSVSGGSDLVADDPNADRIVFWDDSEGKWRYLEAGSGLSISGTTMTVTATGGANNLWVPSSAFIPKTTSGCGVDSRETTTNDQNFDELLFDAGSDEFADALVVMPSNYNNGTLTARFYWTAASGSGDVIWGIQGRAFANDDALDTAAGTAQTVTDTLIAANDMHVTSATSAVTIGGTPAANTPIQFSIYRDANAAGDTLAVDARLLGVEIIFN
jgi:hypothetical protein